MSKLISFATERVGSLVSKKLGATVVAEAALVAADGVIPPGLPTLVWVIVQAVSETAKYYIDVRYGDA